MWCVKVYCVCLTALYFITLLNTTPLYHTTLHYTTLHYTTLHYTTLHYTTPHYTTLQCTPKYHLLSFALILPQSLWANSTCISFLPCNSSATEIPPTFFGLLTWPTSPYSYTLHLFTTLYTYYCCLIGWAATGWDHRDETAGQDIRYRACKISHGTVKWNQLAVEKFET